MYSQNNEEQIINDLFGDTGMFLDVGAYDGKWCSNTLRLHERGWCGVLVEPAPSCFAALERQYAKKPRAKLVNAAISNMDGMIEIHESGPLSTTSIAFIKEWPDHKFVSCMIRAITWKTLFDEYGSNYDFVNIDTEGTNLDVLRMFPFEHCRPLCICIEHERKWISTMLAMLKTYGYREVARTGENLIVGL
jgi:FkbM family methyltransferase